MSSLSSVQHQRATRRAQRADVEAPGAKRRLHRSSTAMTMWTRSLITFLVPPEQQAAFAKRHSFLLQAAPDARVSYEASVSVWTALTDKHPNALFGIHFAAGLEPAQLGIAGYLASMSQTFEEAIARIVRFHRLLKDPSQNALVRTRDSLTVVDGPPAGHAAWPRHLAEGTLSAYVVLGSRWVGAPVVPLRVSFQHQAPESAAQVTKAFGCEVKFGQRLNSIAFRLATCAQTLKTADPTLSEYLEREATRQLDAIENAADSMLRATEAWVRAHLSQGPTTLRAAARHLALSARTLQSHLADRGLTFEEVVDGVRCSMAATLSADPTVTRSEMAYLLGYSDLSGLRRAELRWHHSRERRT